MISATEYVKNILRRPTERDKQRLVGASNMSNPCTRCLADDIAGNYREQGLYDMGAVLGTAIHDYLDKRNNDENAVKEAKVLLGPIQGYGDITSRTDLYRKDAKQILDFKTTSRDKMATYRRIIENGSEDGFDSETMEKARTTLTQYVHQAMLYAYGAEEAGAEVKSVAIVFVCRDGQIIDRDIWGFEMPYDRHIAENTFDRTMNLYNWLQAGNDVNQLESHPDCYYCSEVRPYVRRKVEL